LSKRSLNLGEVGLKDAEMVLGPSNGFISKVSQKYSDICLILAKTEVLLILKRNPKNNKSPHLVALVQTNDVRTSVLQTNDVLTSVVQANDVCTSVVRTNDVRTSVV